LLDSLLQESFSDYVSASMSRKKVEREVRAAHRRNKRDKQHMGEEYDDFLSLSNQLGTLGLTLKKITGDGNCLFRALGDQLEGSGEDHMNHRVSVVNYIRKHREEFEPFVEDDISFDIHLASLAENGTFGGNDSIVAFARLHNLSVVIHQLNKPLWQIHGDGNISSVREMHISYHNGDHYNSVRRIGDITANIPARVRLKKDENVYKNCDNYRQDSDQESDYENRPSNSKLNKLALEVADLAGLDVTETVFSAIELNAYCVSAAVDYLLQKDVTISMEKSSLWGSEGTGSRIFGEKAAINAVSQKSSRSNQDRLANIQQKLGDRNLSNKKRKELKNNQRKIENTERKKKQNDDQDNSGSDTEIAIANFQSLTI